MPHPKTDKVEESPDLSYLEEKLTITNLHPFRRQGSPCHNCGSKEEKLLIQGKAVFLVCAKCGKEKSQAPFLEGKLLLDK
jgi:translation initiation factor 2 beta subunit (eIF-2beta)/eIF-5